MLICKLHLNIITSYLFEIIHFIRVEYYSFFHTDSSYRKGLVGFGLAILLFFFSVVISENPGFLIIFESENPLGSWANFKRLECCFFILTGILKMVFESLAQLFVIKN